MWPSTVLDHGGFRDTVEGLLKRFKFESKTPQVEPKEWGSNEKFTHLSLYSDRNIETD